MLNKNNGQHKLKSFILLFIGQTISQFGSAMTSFATIIWAYTAHGEVMASSLLAICSTIPYLIVSLLGGAIVDKTNKKKIMLVCDTIAAIGSAIILLCFFTNSLYLWILCIVNVISGFMNAFQTPASQVAVSLLVEKKDYARIGGIQSIIGSIVNILTPIVATTILAFGGLGMVLCIDLFTFLLAFLSLLLFVRIPDMVLDENKLTFSELRAGMKEGIGFLRNEKSILLLFLMYSILEFMGAISFDSMYSPLLLARTNNNEMVVGVVSSFIAAGCMAASIVLSILKQPQRELPIMYIGSFMCLFGIMFFGMGQSLTWWCIVAFVGCFGSPIYQTYQTVILRERVPINMQGRIFAMQGMITQMLAPIGYLLGAMLADYCLEPFMKKEGSVQLFLSTFVGKGNGAGIGLIFVFAGLTGIILLAIISRNKTIRKLDCISVECISDK